MPSLISKTALVILGSLLSFHATVDAATCTKYDYIVVGAGAGGGPVASRLAIAGFKVLLIDAGSTYTSTNVTTPIMHLAATEDPNISWEYFVQHYPAGSPYGRQDVFYPRSSGIGGCTAHHAMLGLYPFAKDWDNLASLTGDASWKDSNMRSYFEKLEDNRYAAKILGNHGRGGWLPTSQIDLRLALDPIDIKLLSTFASFATSSPLTLFGDINYPGANEREGWHLPPVMIGDGKRVGTYNLIMDTKAKFPNNLDIMTDTLVTKILVDDKNVAYGVQVAKGKALYHASPLSDKKDNLPALEEITVNREVILSAGSYSTPQLLMLSGIGDRSQLSKFNISTKVHLPGVGRNLQDRYEVSVNYELKEPWGLTKDCLFKPIDSDTCWKDYLANPKTTLYGSQGVAVASARKSFDEVDTYIFFAPAPFSGYRKGYSLGLQNNKNTVSILILKAKTNNTNGEVTLRSPNPRQVPAINFNYFSDGTRDLDAVVKQIKAARDLGDFITLNPFVTKELVPGKEVDTDEELRDHVRRNAWGHHACCTAKIGKDSDPMAVLDSNFKVRGVKGLRVVDASVFPKIPGFFIVVPIYMASEKAADVIVADAKANPNVCTA